MPLCPTCVKQRPPYPEVTEANCRVPSASFSQAPWYTLPVHLCRFRVRSIIPVLFPGPIHLPLQSSKEEPRFRVVTSGGPGNIHPVSIGYGCRPRLRGRLTLRGLALRRNPWTFGGRVSHSPCRYSCPHSHFPYLQDPSRVSLHRPRERSATAAQTARLVATHSFGSWLEPRYIFAAEQLLDQ